MLSNPSMTVFVCSFPLWFRMLLLVLSSQYVSFTIPNKRHFASLGGIIKRMRLSIHSPYVSLDFSDCITVKSSIRHNAFSGMKFVVIFVYIMRKLLKEAFSDWSKSPSSVAIDNETEVIGH